MLNKKIIAVAIFTLLFVEGTASAANFGTTTLKVGSRGEAVKALQTLVGAGADGSFGPMTKAKVMVWQSANGLTADGLFGNMSKAKAHGMATAPTAPATTVAGCAAGAMFSSTTGAACTTAPASAVAGCAAGAMFSSTTGAACAAATVVSTGEGSIVVSYEGSPVNSLTVNKGEAKDVLAIKIKATGSDMKVTRLWLDVASRIWLSADTATLKDGSTVVATLPLTASTVTEVTAGSAWRLEFNGLNFMVAKDATKVLTLSINRPALTINNDTWSIATSTLRAVDGSGISATYAPTGTRAITMGSAAATAGTLTSALNTSSPVAKSVTGLSITAGVTTAVKLMDFDLKSVDGPINATAIASTLIGGTVANMVASVELRDGSTVIASVAGAASFTFSSLNINVATGTTKTLSVFAIMNPIGTPGAGFTTKGQAITAAIGIVTASSGPAFSNVNTSNTVTGNAQYMYEYAPTIVLGTASATTIAGSLLGETQGVYSLSFVVTAPSGRDIYVDMPTTLTAVTKIGTAGGTLAKSSTVSGLASVGTVFTAADKVVGGTSRTFTVTAQIPDGVSAGFAGVTLVNVTWTDVDHATSPALITQTWGLSDIKTGTVYVSL